MPPVSHLASCSTSASALMPAEPVAITVGIIDLPEYKNAVDWDSEKKRYDQERQKFE